MYSNLILFGLLFIFYNIIGIFTETLDEGFIIFCPCMGRFGNQIEQFLGVLAFSKHLNRTLVLPPLIEYHQNSIEAKMIEFDSFFQLEKLKEFHQIITMKKFMKFYAPIIWPPNIRKVICWSPRKSLNNPNSFGCHPNEGNPFGPFWRYCGIKFIGDEYFGEKISSFNTENEYIRKKWLIEYPINKYPVLAFSSAPASFPLLSIHRPLQKYLKWTNKIEFEAKEFIKRNFGNKEKFVAIHLRNGPDWINACKHFDGQNHFFASKQCTGENNEYGYLTLELCNSSISTILNNITNIIKKINANGLFISSDFNNNLELIQLNLNKYINWPIKVIKYEENEESNNGKIPAIEMSILSFSDHFIGNCISTFSAFIVRQRLFCNKLDKNEISFFGFKQKNEFNKNEL